MLLTIADQTQPLQEWALDYGIPCRIIRARLGRGWDHERAVTTPIVQGANVKLTAADMRDEPPTMPLALARRTITPPMIEPRTYKVRKYTHYGLSLSAREWADRIGISLQAMHHRLKVKNGAEAFAPSGVRTQKIRYTGGA